MSKKRAYGLIIFTLILALLIPAAIHFLPNNGTTQTISLTAKRYGYSPARIVVNKGDTVVLKPTSEDVTHGFFLDGYPVEFIIKQKGINYLKYTWEDDDGKLQTDWDKVSEIEFVADKEGKFIFRCTQTCGNLHPFMTGELIVKPNTPYYLFVSLSCWLTLAFLILFRIQPAPRFTGFKRINLLDRFSWLKWLVKRRSLQFLVIFPNFVVFYLFILSALWGTPVGNRNIAIIFVWIAWWFVLKAVFVPLGARTWCLICPLPAPAEWLSRKSLTAVRYIRKPFKGLHHRFVGLQKDWPEMMRNIWLQNFIFLALISFGIILITRPIATAIVFLAILMATFIFALIYRRRVFCLYLCPVGGSLGTYAMASMTEVRVKDRDICKNHNEKSCVAGGKDGWACPWVQYQGEMDRNNYCGFCTECIKSCPKDNMGIFVRSFGSDRTFAGYDEMFNAFILLVVALSFSVTMLGPWGTIRAAANITESRQLWPFILYLISIWGTALVAAPGLFAIAAKGAIGLAGGDIDFKTFMLKISYIIVPIGISAWISFSISPLMTNYGYILNVLSDPLGFGWDLFGTSNYPFHPLIPEWIPLLQGGVLLVGLYLGVSRGYLAIIDLFKDPRQRAMAMVPPSLFVLLVINVFLWLFLE